MSISTPSGDGARAIRGPAKYSLPVDVSGELGNGETFRDIVSFKELLVKSHRHQFARCLTEKLLTYSMGRTLEPADTQHVDRITAELNRRGRGLRDLELLIAESDPFTR